MNLSAEYADEDGDAVLVLPAECDAATATALLPRLRHRVAGVLPDAPLQLDLTEGRPTAFALQLIVSARKSLVARSAFAGLGRHAAAALPNDS